MNIEDINKLAEYPQLKAENERLRRMADLVRARCRDAVPGWAPELRAALRELDSVSESADTEDENGKR